jgi:hypothetical protein
MPLLLSELSSGLSTFSDHQAARDYSLETGLDGQCSLAAFTLPRMGDEIGGRAPICCPGTDRQALGRSWQLAAR